MKLFRSEQIREIDKHTIAEEPVSSIDLMERAADQILRWFLPRFERTGRVYIFVGPGNNGGDGLALARMLFSHRYDVSVFFINFTDKTSDDWSTNLLRLKSESNIEVTYLSQPDQFPQISSEDVIIDAIFGTGLGRPAEGLTADIIKLINKAESKVISIDIPSGLFGEDNSENDFDSIIIADYTLSFQFPKLSFMFAENAEYLGEWTILPIGLSPMFIAGLSSPFSLTEKHDAAKLLKKRNKFDHKGTFGHGLLIAGSYGKMGAAVLGASAALRSGIGLITCHTPGCGVTIVQSSVKEAMVEADASEMYFSSPGNSGNYSAVGVGPGLGTSSETQKALKKLLLDSNKPIVIDADGLNILSLNKEWLASIPKGSILTPHPREFERLAGESANSYERLNKQMEFSHRYKCVIVLKGAHTSISTPDCTVRFNTTGNPGMATAGTGDTLTGILLSLLAQGYNPENAAVLGVYLHGLAGDIAAEESCYESIIASDIINCLPKAFNEIRKP